MAYTVKRVSEMAGVSIRALHHYDAIGLLRPAGATEAGYRLYSEEDVRRLQQILFYRELELKLKEIGVILDGPGFDPGEALRNHRKVLRARRARLSALIQTIDRTLESLDRGTHMEDKDLFDGFDPAKYEDEARQRWGDTLAWKESQKRTKGYTREDWTAIRKENTGIVQAIAARMGKGPSDPQVQKLVKRYHDHINNRYYTCTVEIFRGLADNNVDDPRFTATWEKIKPGMARFMQSAMIEYCNAQQRKAGV
jgi:DNA-binding transcriptional MerR regulator